MKGVHVALLPALEDYISELHKLEDLQQKQQQHDGSDPSAAERQKAITETASRVLCFATVMESQETLLHWFAHLLHVALSVFLISAFAYREDGSRIRPDQPIGADWREQFLTKVIVVYWVQIPLTDFRRFFVRAAVAGATRESATAAICCAAVGSIRVPAGDPRSTADRCGSLLGCPWRSIGGQWLHFLHFESQR